MSDVQTTTSVEKFFTVDASSGRLVRVRVRFRDGAMQSVTVEQSRPGTDRESRIHFENHTDLAAWAHALVRASAVIAEHHNGPEAPNGSDGSDE